MTQGEVCPGCGMKHPGEKHSLHDRYNATEACWGLYGELSAYYMTYGDNTFKHQHSVDAYGAQHTGDATAAITTVFSLIGLYLALEQGRTGRQVQLAHMELGKRKTNWPNWNAPNRLYRRTVLDVLQAEPGAPRDTMQREWMQDVWDAWALVHDEVRRICAERLA